MENQAHLVSAAMWSGLISFNQWWKKGVGSSTYRSNRQHFHINVLLYVYISPHYFFGCFASSRMWHLVSPTWSQRLRFDVLWGGAAETRQAVQHRKGSWREKRGVCSVPCSCGPPPRQAVPPPAKRCAHKFPRRWPQMWPGPRWSLGTLDLNGFVYWIHKKINLFSDNHNWKY